MVQAQKMAMGQAMKKDLAKTRANIPALEKALTMAMVQA